MNVNIVLVTNPPLRKPRHPRRREHSRSARAHYDKANRECAEIVLSDIQKYGGPGSLMVLWAEAVIHGQECKEREWRLTQ